MRPETRPIREIILVICALVFFCCLCVESWYVALGGIILMAAALALNPEMINRD